MSAPARRVYLSFPPGWDRMSEEQKREAALGIARAMQRALRAPGTSPTSATLGGASSHDALPPTGPGQPLLAREPPGSTTSLEAGDSTSSRACVYRPPAPSEPPS